MVVSMGGLPKVSLDVVRRLAVTKQRLAGPRPHPDAEGIIEAVRDLGCVQIDPVSVVAPSHLLVLWSRLGRFDTAELDRLLWEERRLFQGWAQATSILPMDEYPTFACMMRGWGKGDSSWERRASAWLDANEGLRRHVLEQIGSRGPLSVSAIEDRAAEGWRSTGWTDSRNVSQMLYFLWAMGEIMVAGRSGGKKLWELTGRFLPDWAPRDELSWEEIAPRITQRSLKALGVATEGQIRKHYVRNCYPRLPEVLGELESEGAIERVDVMGSEGRRALRGTWYVHAEDFPLLDRLEEGDWGHRTTLLSPFDNLISDRRRTRQVFGFQYGLELYTPKEKRRYGAYVMPILRGGRLIGRIDPKMDRGQETLNINAVYAEPDAPMDVDTASEVAAAIDDLMIFLGAEEVVYGDRIPEGWRGALG